MTEEKKDERIRIVHTASLGADGISSFAANVASVIDHDSFVVDALTYRHGQKFARKRIEEPGGRVYVVDIENIKCKPLKMWRKFWGVYRVMKNNHISVFHLNTESSDQVFLAFAAKLAGVKTVLYHSHSSQSGRVGIHRKVIEDISRAFMPLAVDDYLACSEAAARSVFPKKIIKKKQYLIVNNGICAEKYRYNRERREAYREQLGLKKELVLMHVGRFIPLKRQDFLVEVLDALTRMGCDSVLVLVGEGETMEAVKAKAEEMKLKDRVRFLGVRRDIHKLLQMADVFVLPSQYEGVPIAGIEAQAAGLPCLISKGVSKDMKLTEPVTYLSLEKGAVAWAKEALRLSAFKRRDTLEEIKKSGYDMTEAVKVLSKLYMGKSRGERV